MKPYKTYYYSFYLGYPGAKRKDWLFVDIKMPASCLREAILLHQFSKDFALYERRKNQGKKKIYVPPAGSLVNMVYRSVIEYERIFTPRRGYTVHQYKKNAVYSIHSILKEF